MVIFNNITNVQMGLKEYDYPKVSASNEEITLHPVVGRLGSLIENKKVRESITVSCTFSLINSALMQKHREIKKWLSGTGYLCIDDEKQFFYEVQYIRHGDVERELKKYGRFTVVFYCIPYEYAYTGLSYITPGASLYNPYDECMPIYKIAGEGICVLTVNGKRFEMNVGQDVTIDTSLMLAYRTEENLNASVKGNYEDLYLKPGDNEISITSGFELTVSPRWGYIA